MALADLGDDERADDRRQDPEPRLGEPEPGPRLGDDEVGDGAQAHPATERRAMDARDHRRRTRVDGLEHLGHRHRVLLVALGVERHRGAHPVEVGAGAERRSVAGQDDRAKLARRFAGEQRERGPQLGDQRGVERVVDVRAVERHAGNDAIGSCALDPQAAAGHRIHRGIVRHVVVVHGPW